MKDQALPGLELRAEEVAAVPDGAVEAGVRETAGGGFGREGDADAEVPVDLGGLMESGLVVEGELPLAVEGGPLGAAQLRAGVVGVVVLHFR